MADEAIEYVPIGPQMISELHLHSYFQYLAMTILYYDHLVTFRDEVNLIWGRRKMSGAYCFFANRYLAFFGNIVVAVCYSYPLSPSACRSYGLFRQLLLLVTQVLVGVLLTLRIYALYRCSKRILAFMVGCGAILIGVSCSSLLGQKSEVADPATGCHVGLSKNTSIHLAIAWEALFVYDTLVMFMTLYKSYRSRYHDPLVRTHVPLVWLIVRDGSMFFAVMALANLANILTFYFAGTFVRGGLSTFASCISVTMMSRLMLNLHQNADTGITTVGPSTTNMLETNMFLTTDYDHDPITETDTEMTGFSTSSESRRGARSGTGADLL